MAAAWFRTQFAICYLLFAIPKEHLASSARSTGYTISLPEVPDIAQVDPAIPPDQSRRSAEIGVRQIQIPLLSLCLPGREMRRKNLPRLEWRKPFDVS
jgi:hypothetical protein